MSPITDHPQARHGAEPGDALRYTPTQSHCREGTAFVDERGVARDTFWRPEGDGESHVLTQGELETAQTVFSVRDFRLLDRYASASREAWETYHPRDHGRITMQHGLEEVLYVRIGAEPDLGTQIKNAEAALAGAEQKSRSAQSTVERRRAELTELQCAGEVPA